MIARSLADRSPALPVFAVASAVLGWLAFADMGFRDSGELGAAGFGLGVAHPTGFAVDMLLLRAASLWPIGHIAFRQNLCVALEAALALGLLAELCDRLARRLGVESAAARWAGAGLAAAGLLTWATFLGTALCVEVYSLALLAVALAGVCAARGGRAAGAVCVVVGLALGLHVTAGLLALLVLAAVLAARGPRRGLRFAAARAPVVLAGALIVAYLPLASLRDPAVDWGDPETFARLLDHLSASRIRTAYAGQMLASDPRASLLVFTQLLELWPLLPLAAVALVAGLRSAPAAVLLPLAALTADLAYAVWINPMGAGDRQVGHVAGASLALLAGLGAAWLGWRLARTRAGLLASAVGGSALLGALVLRVPRAELSDPFAAAELLGSGGPLSAMPPRALLLCASDDSCAAGLFALHVERVRPDVEALPVQHLWDPTVLRRLRGVPAVDPDVPYPPLRERRALADLRLRVWATARAQRPLRFESPELLQAVGVAAPLLAAEPAPYYRSHGEVHRGTFPERLARFDRLRAARTRPGEPRSERAQYAWSIAHGALGDQAQRADPRTALRAWQTAVELAPTRASAHTNLGVVLEATGDPDAAEQAYRRAIALAPTRPIAWYNLARLGLQRSGPDAAREVLKLAKNAGASDARLDQLAAALEQR